MEDSNSQSTSRNSLISKVRSVITLEPAIFMCTLGYGLQSIISQVSFQKKLDYEKRLQQVNVSFQNP